MGVASKIFLYLVPLVLLIVISAILFGGEGLFTKVKEAVLSAKDYLPSFSLGLEEQKADVSIPDVHRAEIIKLRETIAGMIGAGKENCFANYGALSELGEAGTSFVFNLENGKTFLTVFGGAGGKQVITDLSGEVQGMKPCVIAGPSGESEHFFKHFMQGQELIYPYFSQVNSLSISYNTQAVNENTVAAPELELENDLDDQGWLFTPDGEQICFFPTNDVSDYGDEGIDNDYFTRGQKNSVPNRIDEGALKMC